MKIMLRILFLLGFASVVINAWINALKTASAAGVLFGTTFGLGLIVFGSVIIFFDLLLILIYFLKKRKYNKNTQMKRTG